MDDMTYFAVLDVGTTTVKTYIVDKNGVIVGKNVQEYESITPGPDLHEQDPEIWWRILGDSMKNLLRVGSVDKEDITSVTLITQRATILPIDKNGVKLHNAVTWMDARKPEVSEELEEVLTQRVGAQKILWFKKNMPNVYEKTYKFVFTDSYIAYKMIGEPYSSPAQGVYLFYDDEKGKYDEDILSSLDIDVDKLPKIVETGTNLGEISKEAAEHLGLSKSTEFIMGSGDQQCSALGLSLFDIGETKVTLGTGTFIDAVIEEKIFDFYEPMSHLFILPYIVKNKWLIEAVVPGTGATLKWYLENFGSDLKKLAAEENKNPYGLLDELASKAPAGSDGLFLVPLLTFGRGLIYGLSLKHAAAHFVRAILESAGFGIRFFIELFENLDFEINVLRIDGGGSKSRFWGQIIADITGKEILISKAGADAAAVGGAIISSVGKKIYRDFQQAAETMVEFVSKIEPDIDKSDIYENIYGPFVEQMVKMAEGLKV